MGRTACTEPQCLYKGALYVTVELYLYSPYWPYGLYRASVPVQGCTILFYLKSWNAVTHRPSASSVKMSEYRNITKELECGNVLHLSAIFLYAMRLSFVFFWRVIEVSMLAICREMILVRRQMFILAFQAGFFFFLHNKLIFPRFCTQPHVSKDRTFVNITASADKTQPLDNTAPILGTHVTNLPIAPGLLSQAIVV